MRIARAIWARLKVAFRPVARRVEAMSLPRFATPLSGFEMQRPRSISNAGAIHVGRDVKIGPNSVLKANTRFPGGWMKHPEGKHVEQRFTPSIRIGDRVTATSSLHVAAFQEIVIEDDVMLAGNVFLCDGLHAYESADVPYKFQGIFRVAPIRVGRGSWLGQNVVVMPGVTIGELAIVGANSVVTSDVPPKTIVGGVPARLLRRWDAAAAAWVAVDAGASEGKGRSGGSDTEEHEPEA